MSVVIQGENWVSLMYPRIKCSINESTNEREGEGEREREGREQKHERERARERETSDTKGNRSRKTKD